MDLFPAFEHAVTSTAEIVKAVPGGQLDAPTWDLAVATGQPGDLDGRLAAHALGFAGQSLATAESRGGRIGPALPVAADAPVTQRLVAFLGRRP